MSTNEKVIKAAKLMLLLENSKGKKAKEAGRLFDQAMKKLEPCEFGLVRMMHHLLEGRRFNITSDVPETIQRATELAQAIGGSVFETSEPTGLNAMIPAVTNADMISIIVSPPGRELF